MNVRMILIGLLVASVGLAGCKSDSEGSAGEEEGGGEASGKSNLIAIDGSSTVYPINEAVAEEFGNASGHRVNIGVSGTGGGFKKFCRGELDVTGASRPISPEEVEMCKAEGISYIEIPVAYDGISVVVNPANDFVESMTVAELEKMWKPASEGKVTKWNQIRDDWPDKKFSLYGAGIASGTYDYFTQAVVGQEHSSRGDFTSSEDDNVLVQGVANDPNALGFFGFAYYDENKDSLKAVGIKTDAEAKPVLPSRETISKATYQPLTRPLFIYVSEKSAEENPAVPELVEFYLTESEELIEYAGYVPLPEETNKLLLERFEARETGSVFGGEGSKIGVSVADLLRSGADAEEPGEGEDAEPTEGADGNEDEAAEGNADEAEAGAEGETNE
ncbi:MAG: phosphate ABC transporter substrate-binding protein PstS family protein [Myxococcota bacterium]